MINAFDIYQTALHGICVIDKDFKILFWNIRMFEITGTPSETAQGKYFPDVFPEAKKRSILNRFKLSFDLGTPTFLSPHMNLQFVPCLETQSTSETETTPPQKKFYEISFIPNTLENPPWGVVTIRDVSDQIGSIIRLQSLSRVKNRFLDVCSHDLKLPLETIMAISLWRSQNPKYSEKMKKEFGKIRSAAELLNEFICDLMNLSKLQSNPSQIKLGPLLLSEVCQRSFEINQVIAERKGIQFLFQDLTIDKAPIYGNLTELTRMVNNLLSNAIKFTKANGTIQLIIRPIGTDKIEITVHDTGKGIKSEDIHFLFDRFSKTSQSGTSGEKGTGLGMSIVKQIADIHSAKIDLQSEVGIGTRIAITFQRRPLTELQQALTEVFEATESPRSPVSQETTSVQSAQHRPRKILLIDDNSEFRKILKIFLNRTHHLIETAENGSEGMAKFMLHEYDLVLLDIELGDITGYEVAREMRTFERSHSKTPTPIVACTIHSEKKELAQAIDSGCTDYLCKPVSFNKLIETIERF